MPLEACGALLDPEGVQGFRRDREVARPGLGEPRRFDRDVVFLVSLTVLPLTAGSRGNYIPLIDSAPTGCLARRCGRCGATPLSLRDPGECSGAPPPAQARFSPPIERRFLRYRIALGSPPPDSGGRYDSRERKFSTRTRILWLQPSVLTRN